jgi:hypothetical protein
MGFGAAIIGAGVLMAASQISSGEAKAGAARYNAQMARYEAEYAEKRAEMEEQQHRRKLARFIGEQMVSGGRAGYAGVGSDLTPLIETAKAGEFDAALIRYAGAVDSWRYKAESDLYKRQAGQYRLGGYLGAGSTLLNTVGFVL